MPTIITNATELKAIENDMAGNYILGNDIDLDGANFEPIGYEEGDGYSAKFRGMLDGNGYKIHNGTIEYEYEDYYIGLFAFIAGGGTVKNLGMEINIRGGYRVGAIAGVCYSINFEGVVLIDNCYNTGNVQGDWGSIGGLSGHCEGSITNSYNTGSVSADTETDEDGGVNVGGLAGLFWGDEYLEIGYMTDCYNTGNIYNVNFNGGGLVGELKGDAGYLDRCYNTGSVNSAYDQTSSMGGLIGNSQPSRGYMTNCYNIGIITSGGWFGGLIGTLNAPLFDVFTIENCYNAGELIITESDWSDYVGGLVGTVDGDENVEFINCYWDTEASGKADAVGDGDDTGVYGKTTAEMKDINTFLPEWDIAAQGEVTQDENGWNDNYTWGIGTANDGYPFLRLVDVIPFDVWVKKAGTWKTCSDIWVKKGGAWRPVVGVWVKKQGQWQPV